MFSKKNKTERKAQIYLLYYTLNYFQLGVWCNE